MGERLSDIVNVKDWGALGNGSRDDTTAIQNAINYCLSTTGGKQPGGIVFFPPGNYPVSSVSVGSSNPNARAILIGSGQQFGCRLTANYNGGFVVSKGSGAYDNLQSFEGIDIINGSATVGTGCIKVTGTACSIRNSYMNGMILVDASRANGCTICDVLGNGRDQNGTSGSVYPLSQNGIGFLLGNNCIAQNCRIQGSTWLFFALSGNGAAVMGCSCEVGTIGIRLGWGWTGSDYGEVPAIGCVVQGNQTEKCQTGIELYNCQACLVQGNYFFGNVGPPDPQAITNALWDSSSHIITVTTAGNHNLGTGFSDTPLAVAINPGTFTPRIFSYCTYLSLNQFTYPGPSTNPGTFDPSNSSWSYPLKWTMRCRKVSETAIISNFLNMRAAFAELDLDYLGDANTVHASNICYANFGGRSGWKPPTATKNLAGWRFVQSGATNFDNNSIATNPNLASAMSYGDLPGQFPNPNGIYQPGPIEGQEYNIVDGQKGGSPGLEAGFADIVVGGGSGRYKVRYDGANWRRCG